MDWRAELGRRLFEKKREALKVQKQQNLEISDSLALERPLLAYMRAAMGLVLAGLTFTTLFGDDPLCWGIGVASVPAGLTVALLGYGRFDRKNRQVAAHMRAYK